MDLIRLDINAQERYYGTRDFVNTVNPNAVFSRGATVQVARTNLEQLIQLSNEVACINVAISQIEWDLLCLGELDTQSNTGAQGTGLYDNRPPPKKPATSATTAAKSSSVSTNDPNTGTSSTGASGSSSSSAFHSPSTKHKTDVPTGARPIPTRTTASEPRPWEAPTTLSSRATKDEKITKILTGEPRDKFAKLTRKSTEELPNDKKRRTPSDPEKYLDTAARTTPKATEYIDLSEHAYSTQETEYLNNFYRALDRDATNLSIFLDQGLGG